MQCSCCTAKHIFWQCKNCNSSVKNTDNAQIRSIAKLRMPTSTMAKTSPWTSTFAVRNAKNCNDTENILLEHELTVEVYFPNWNCKTLTKKGNRISWVEEPNPEQSHTDSTSFLISQHPGRKHPGQVHSPGIGVTLREPLRSRGYRILRRPMSRRRSSQALGHQPVPESKTKKPESKNKLRGSEKKTFLSLWGLPWSLPQQLLPAPRVLMQTDSMTRRITGPGPSTTAGFPSAKILARTKGH